MTSAYPGDADVRVGAKFGSSVLVLGAHQFIKRSHATTRDSQKDS